MHASRSARARAAFDGVTKGTTVPYIDNRNRGKSRAQYHRHLAAAGALTLIFAVFPTRGFLFAELARREITAVDRLRSELRRVVFPICADVAVSLDHRVPELVLVVAKLLLLLDLLDVDVLDRALGGEVEPHGAARRVERDGSH